MRGKAQRRRARRQQHCPGAALRQPPPPMWPAPHGRHLKGVTWRMWRWRWWRCRPFGGAVRSAKRFVSRVGRGGVAMDRRWRRRLQELSAGGAAGGVALATWRGPTPPAPPTSWRAVEERGPCRRVAFADLGALLLNRAGRRAAQGRWGRGQAGLRLGCRLASRVRRAAGRTPLLRAVVRGALDPSQKQWWPCSTCHAAAA